MKLGVDYWQFDWQVCVCVCVVQLLNQLDESGSGAPPASTEQIDALPTVSILQSQVGELRQLFVFSVHFCCSFRHVSLWWCYEGCQAILSCIAWEENATHGEWVLLDIGSGAYEARRLVSPQNLGPRGTLWNVPLQNFCRQMLLDLQVIVLGAFYGIKHTQKSISAAAAPDPTGGAYTALPYPIADGERSYLPLPKNLTQASALKLCCSVPPHFWLSSAAPVIGVFEHGDRCA